MTISERDTADPAPAPDGDAQLTLLGHDLRSAVADLVGGLRLLDLGRLDPDMRSQVERIHATADALALMMNDGLALLLGDAASGTLTSVRLAQLLCDADMRWGGQAREKGMTFTVSVSREVPDLRLPDRVALERALSNTLSNALKYGEGGAVRLDVAMTASGALQISVTDQGPGFSPEAMARIFDFGGRPTGAMKPGQGLGMHITRRMSGRLGGTVIVENRPEGGARVTLELPPERWLTTAPPDISALPDLGGKRVLIVDDTATCRALVAGTLTRMGAACTSAADGAEALDLLARGETFDLMLVDIEMPGRSGLDVIAEMQGMAHRPPVIALTAHARTAMHDRIRAAGAKGIIVKPLADMQTLGRAVADVLAAPAAPEHAPTPGSAADHPAPALQRLVQTAGPALAREVLSHLYTDLRRVRQDLTTGLADRLAPLVSAASHVLIALAGTVGADRLRALATDLNRTAHECAARPTSPSSTELLALLDRLISHVEGERIRLEVQP